MAKVQKLSELSQRFSFTEYDFFDFYHRSFGRSELGRIKKHLPLREMAESFGLVSNRRAPKRGRKPYFTPEGKNGANPFISDRQDQKERIKRQSLVICAGFYVKKCKIVDGFVGCKGTLLLPKFY